VADDRRFLPWMKLYGADWLDGDLALVSKATKGIWSDLLVYMLNAPVRGRLTKTLDEYAQLLRCPREEVWAALKELAENGIGGEPLFVTCHAMSQTSHADFTGDVTVESGRLRRADKVREGARLRKQAQRGRERCHAHSHADFTHIEPEPDPDPDPEKKKERTCARARSGRREGSLPADALVPSPSSEREKKTGPETATGAGREPQKPLLAAVPDEVLRRVFGGIWESWPQCCPVRGDGAPIREEEFKEASFNAFCRSVRARDGRCVFRSPPNTPGRIDDIETAVAIAIEKKERSGEYWPQLHKFLDWTNARGWTRYINENGRPPQNPLPATLEALKGEYAQVKDDLQGMKPEGDDLWGGETDERLKESQWHVLNEKRRDYNRRLGLLNERAVTLKAAIEKWSV